MARRRSNDLAETIVVFVALLRFLNRHRLAAAGVVILLVASVAARNAAVGLIVATVYGGVAYWWKQRNDALMRERTIQSAAGVRETERQKWRETEFEPGPFSVSLQSFRDVFAQRSVELFLRDLPEFRERSDDEAEAFVERVVHVSPQLVAEGVAQRDAVRLKMALEASGAKAKIIEGVPSRVAAGREAIPANVRREVWRRDSGRCVDCGSRERLEYDHIIPVSKGGANTTRNLELRCEPCNRKKGATI